MSIFSQLINTLSQAGLSGQVLTSTVQTIMQNSPRTAVMNYCTVILSNANNPTVIKDMAVKMAEIPNLPVAVANLLPELVAAQTVQQVNQIVQSIEAAVGGHGFFGF